MSTVYDWVTVLIFIGLLALYFLREDGADVPLGRYIVAAAGCALANWFGNEGFSFAAMATIAATLGFAYVFILTAARPGKGAS